MRLDKILKERVTDEEPLVWFFVPPVVLLTLVLELVELVLVELPVVEPPVVDPPVEIPVDEPDEPLVVLPKNAVVLTAQYLS